jgi:hypothetical protein
MKSWTCCICGKDFDNPLHSNSPKPIKNNGRCCHNCNWEWVIPQRIRDQWNQKDDKETIKEK